MNRFDVAAAAAIKMPGVLAKNGFANPSGPSIFQGAFGPDSDCFKHLAANPESLEDFHKLMAGQRHHRVDWYEFVPVREILLENSDTKAADVLLVDVGGAHGSELVGFHKEFPEATGRLILQDLPSTIESIRPGELPDDIETMKYDFFTAQPVQGAKAYYFRSIMHDWPDQKCKEILKNTISAMRPGYSKLFINEWVLPDSNAVLYPALLDINMMCECCHKGPLQKADMYLRPFW